MAYKTEELKSRAIGLITSKNLIFHTDVFTLLGIDSSTYYVHFSSDSSDYKELDDLLQANKTNMKNGLRKKWYESDNPTMTVALYKLIATTEERKKLSQQYTDITSDGKPVKGASITFEENPTPED